MRIEAYNAVSQVYSSKKPTSVNKTSKTMGRDQVQISSFGKDIQVAKQAVANASDIREDKTAPVKAALINGSYQVSDSDFASKLMEKYEAKFSF